MKIDIGKVATTPPMMDFALCVFGKPSEEISKWADYHSLTLVKSGRFTNINIPESISLHDLFVEPKAYSIVDGFSPNLNKHLHIGHLSNLVIAKAFENMGIGLDFVAILGDTLDGDVSKEDALSKLEEWLKWSDYYINGAVFFASDMILNDDSLLVSGNGKYEGTKGFIADDEYVVGIKSDGSTSYFWQDVALAQAWNGESKLYLTGSEQGPHFKKLAQLFPEGEITHVPLGLVIAKGKKMSSREGNTVMAQEVYDLLIDEFPNPDLAYNVLVGFILNSSPKSTKKLDLDQIKSLKQSSGLYLSYTLARLQSAGLKPESGALKSPELIYALIKSQSDLNPKTLLTALVKLAKKINGLYMDVKIQNNPEGQALFQPMLDDLALGMTFLGMNIVSEV